MTTTAIPSCPWCTDRSEVITLEESDRWPFLCLPCNLAFDGTQQEFDRCIPKRRDLKEAAERKARGLPATISELNDEARKSAEWAESEAAR